ncbi:hypothetical protein V8E54_001102 [Elaphomyces granulatus]
MGTASTMNALAEALGMLPGSSAIPAPYRERAQCAYETGKQIKIRDSSGEQYEDAQYKRATRCLPISTGIGPDIYIDWSRDGWKKQEKLEMDEDDGLDNEH